MLALLTGTFIQFFIIFTIVFIHELGHYLAARIVGWRIQKMVLWIFGGILYTDEQFNRPLREELFVTLFGPVQHLLIYGFLFLSHYINIVPPTIIEQAFFFNTVILVFNLLPIYPLDGGKLMFYLFCYLWSFIVAYQVTLYVSFVNIFLLAITMYVYYPFTLSAYLVCLFLFIENYFTWKNRTYTWIRFLFGRDMHHAIAHEPHFIFVNRKDKLNDIMRRWKKYHENVMIIEETLQQLSEKQLLFLFKHVANTDIELGALFNGTR